VQPIRWIVNTHFHYDHTGGNAEVAADATIIASKATRRRLTSVQQLWGTDHDPLPQRARPNLTIDAEITLNVGNDPVQVRPLPGGHTDGDVVVLLPKSHVAVLGDDLFAGMFPIVHPEHGGSLLALREHLRRLRLDLPADTIIVPGHGPLATRDDLDRLLAMLDASIDYVRAGK